MKLQNLHISHFGHFDNTALDLTGDGVQVLLGPNEAGKSTLLEFLRGLLFGFPERTPYAFGSPERIAGRATLSLADGRTIEMSRRKGRKKTVEVRIDGKETALDDAGFVHLLGNANGHLFASVFAFGLPELSEGEKSLGHESLRSALYGGGLSGAIRPESILSNLEYQAGELFKPQARNPVINALCAELRNLGQDVKKQSIRPEDYDTCEHALQEATEAAKHCQEDLDGARRRYGLMAKLVRALPKWLELQQIWRQRANLQAPPGFPGDGLQRFQAIDLERCRIAAENAALVEEIASVAKQLELIQIDKDILPFQREIEQAAQAIQSIRDARRDLPLRAKEKEDAQRTLISELALLRPGWTLNDLQRFCLDEETRLCLNKLAARRRELDRSVTELETQRNSLRDQLDRAESELQALGPAQDVSLLHMLLKRESDHHAEAKALGKIDSELPKLKRQLEARRARLTPPLEAGSKVSASLPVPRQETVVPVQQARQKLLQEKHNLEESLRGEEERSEQLERTLREQAEGGKVPSLEELVRLRNRRDAGWELLRRKYVEGEALTGEVSAWLAGSGATLPEAYHESVQAADHCADRIYEKAEAVAKREQTAAELERIRLAKNKKHLRLHAVDEAIVGLEERWAALWRPCALVPLEPEAMKAWLEDYHGFVELTGQYDQLLQERDQIGQRLAEYEKQVREALKNPDGEIPLLLAAAHRAVTASQRLEVERENLEKSLQRDGRRLERLAMVEKQLADRGAEWTERWQALLCRLDLPTLWEPDLALTVVERLNQAKTSLEVIPKLEERIASMNARLEEYGPSLGQIAQRVAPELREQLPEDIAGQLARRLSEAQRAAEKRSNLENTLAVQSKKRRENDAQLQLLERRRQRFFALAKVESDPDFYAVAERAEKIRQLDEAAVTLQKEMELIRENEEQVAFEDRLHHGDCELWESELKDLREALAAAERQRSEADARVGHCRAELKRLDGSGAAAATLERLSGKRALLSEAVDRYTPLVLARYLLEQAIRRFERDNQPEMLENVSKILRSMTGDRYVKLERPLGEENAMFLLRDDGRECPPDTLSTGTREQLYLAIRLAYVLHYCRQAEPLPLVLDDVLANFDDQRAERTLRTLGDVAQDVQVLLLTCHPHVVELARGVFPDLKPLCLPARTVPTP